MVLVERWLMGELASVLEASKVEDPERMLLFKIATLHKTRTKNDSNTCGGVGVWGALGGL